MRLVPSAIATLRRARLGIGRIAGGAIAFVLFAWLFAPNLRAFLGSSVVAVPDRQVAAWAHAAASVPFTEAMRWVSALQGTAGMLAMTAVAAALLWRAGQRRAVPLLLLSVPGGMLLNVAVKHAVQRPRPDWVACSALSSARVVLRASPWRYWPGTTPMSLPPPCFGH